MTMNIRLGMAMMHADLNSEKNLKGTASSALAFLRTPISLWYIRREELEERERPK